MNSVWYKLLKILKPITKKKEKERKRLKVSINDDLTFNLKCLVTNVVINV